MGNSGSTAREISVDEMLALIPIGNFKEFIRIYLNNLDHVHRIRECLENMYRSHPEYFRVRDAEGLTLLDHARSNECSHLSKLLFSIESDINKLSLVNPFALANTSANQETYVTDNQHNVEEIKHAIYSLLSMDTASCDPKSKQFCLENGWQPLTYLKLHITFLQAVLAKKVTEQERGNIQSIIDSTALTLRLEQTQDFSDVRTLVANRLKNGKSIILRTGYLQSPSGHAIYIIFATKGNQFEAKVCNLGDGIEHHSSTSSLVPTIKYSFNTLNEVLAYFQNCFACRYQNRATAFSNIYPSSLKLETCENVCVVQHEQTTGNCVVKNLLLAHAQRLHDNGNAALFDKIYHEILVEAISLYQETGGNLQDLPSMSTVCRATRAGELSFLTQKDCSWLTNNLPLFQPSEPTFAATSARPSSSRAALYGRPTSTASSVNPFTISPSSSPSQR